MTRDGTEGTTLSRMLLVGRIGAGAIIGAVGGFALGAGAGWALVAGPIVGALVMGAAIGWLTRDGLR